MMIMIMIMIIKKNKKTAEDSMSQKICTSFTIFWFIAATERYFAGPVISCEHLEWLIAISLIGLLMGLLWFHNMTVKTHFTNPTMHQTNIAQCKIF